MQDPAASSEIEEEPGEPSGARSAERSGSLALSLFAYSLNALVIRAHAGGPLRPGELEATIGWAPHTSLRTAIANLCEFGALRRVPEDNGGGKAGTELTPAGRELLPLADRLERWLERSPDGPLPLDGPAAAGAIRALAAGWDSTIVRMLAERRLCLTELDTEIEGFNYPTLARRLSRLQSTGLIAPVDGRRKGKPYEATSWLRHAIAPLSVAGRWERRHKRRETAPITRVEVEAAFLLTLPTIELPPHCHGTCSLVVMSPAGDGGEKEVAGVTLSVRRGQVLSCASSADPDPDTWGLGTALTWLDAVIDDHLLDLRIGGANPRLPRHIVNEVHRNFFRE